MQRFLSNSKATEGNKSENHIKSSAFPKFRPRSAEISRHRTNRLAFSVRMIDLLPDYINLKFDQPIYITGGLIHQKRTTILYEDLEF